ncbi:hypothetical protein A1OO_03250 [Enterovibrio norvegicus FF-33]|nr:hypothetical protein A1OO_03250 [Enterovibrio norvegicus FF-33]OEE85719.1 hypothetical protein A1OQ_17800 [Enterovibrio norvegicus FF-162]
MRGLSIVLCMDFYARLTKKNATVAAGSKGSGIEQRQQAIKPLSHIGTGHFPPTIETYSLSCHHYACAF